MVKMRYAVLFFLVLLLYGCKVTIIVPEGGSVASGSGLRDCPEGQTCSFDIENGTTFSESFTAQPRRGYVFDRWKKAHKYLCGGSTAPCAFDAPPDLTNIDVELYITPVFSPDPNAASAQRFLFFATSASNSEYFNNLDLTLESSTQYIFRLDLDTLEAVEVESNYSPSYASSTIRSYTTDDSLYVRENYETQHNLTAYDPATLAYRGQINAFRGLEDEGCSAVVGDSYIYRSFQDCDPFFGCTGGDVRRIDLLDGTGSGSGEMMPNDACYGHLGSSGGVLYDALYVHDYDGTTSAFGFYQRNPQTGATTTIAEFTQPNGDAYRSWSYSFHYDGEDIFIIRELVAGGFEVLQYRKGVTSVPVIIYRSGSELPAGFFPAYRDVDDGFVVVGSNEGFILILDSETLTTETLDFQSSIYDLAFIYIEG